MHILPLLQHTGSTHGTVPDIPNVVLVNPKHLSLKIACTKLVDHKFKCFAIILCERPASLRSRADPHVAGLVFIEVAGKIGIQRFELSIVVADESIVAADPDVCYPVFN